MCTRRSSFALGAIVLALSMLVSSAGAVQPHLANGATATITPFGNSSYVLAQADARKSRAAIASRGTRLGNDGNQYASVPGIHLSHRPTTASLAPDNPIPTITGISPTFVATSSPTFTLAISGTGFVSGSTAHWWASDLPTTFVDGAHLRAQMSSFLLTVATPGYVTVVNPAPGGGHSNQLAVDVGMRYAGSIGGGVPTVAISGTLAYVGEGSELSVLDISNPAAPKRLGSYTTRETVQDVEVAGQRAYVTADHDGLLILDIGDPAHPRLLGGYNTPEHAYDVQVVGTTAYVAAEYAGLQIVDVANPAAPRLLGQFGEGKFKAYDLSVVDGVVYIAAGDSFSQFVSVDVHDPAHPTLRDDYNADPNIGMPTGVHVVGKLAYMASSHYLLIADVTTPAQGYPGPYVTYELPESVKDIFVSGNRAYVTSYAGNLFIVDVTDAQNPQLLANYDTHGNSWDVRVVGSRAYVADGIGGLLIVDVGNAQAPAKLGAYATWSAYDLVVDGSRAYVVGGLTGLQILDVGDPAHPKRLGGVPSLGYTAAVQVVGNLAYIANTSIWNGSAYVGGGLQIVNASNPATPVPVTTYPIDSADVRVVGDRAYVGAYYGAKPGGLFILDVHDPAHPKQLGSTSTPIDGLKVEVAGNRAYVLNYDGLYIIDVSNPLALKQLGNYPISHAEDMQVIGDVVHLVDRGIGLEILNTRDPRNISLIGSYAYSYLSHRGVQIVGTRAYLAGTELNDGDLEILDLTSPAAPKPVVERHLSGHALKVQVVSDRIYIASEQGGLQMLQMPTPSVMRRVFIAMLRR